MKKLLIAVFSFVMLGSIAMQAQEADVKGKSITIHAELVNEGYINRDIVFEVYNEVGDTLLASKAVKVKTADTSFNLELLVPEYSYGETFTVVTNGGAEAEYNWSRGERFNVQPYVYTDEQGNTAYQSIFYINLYTKAQQRTYTVYFMDQPVAYPYYLVGDEIYMDERLLSELRINRVNDGNMYTLYSEDGERNVSMSFFKDDIYALENYVGYNLKSPVFEVNGIGYLPLADIARVFACGYEVTETADEVKISMTPSAYRKNPYEEFVNSNNYESKTEYLIWISKKDFEVSLFMGKKGFWKLVGTYPCTIGTDRTPTIEGEFEYIEFLNRWTYPNYYCGPVMRFYNGYALHSTLWRYNGTPYDDRVGMKLSLGCIRLHPADINYLASVTPFKTKIVITP